MSNDLDKIMKGMGKMVGAGTVEESQAIFEEMFKDQIAEAEKGPQMPDEIELEYMDGTKETIVTRKDK